MKFKLGFFTLMSAALLIVGCDQAPKETKTTTTTHETSSTAMNPCHMKAEGKTMLNPCSLEGTGKMLWNDTSLGTTGLACSSCHAGGAQLKLDLAFPHHVGMVKKSVTLPEMINYCLTHPLKGEAIAEDGEKMKAMVAYYNLMAKHDGMKNHCGMGNPCGMKNHCGMGNPCGMKNHCGMGKEAM